MKLGFSDIITFGGDPYSAVNLALVSMNMFSGERIIYGIKIEEGFKNLFPPLSIENGEDNRMPEITFDDVLESAPWDFDFNFEDLLNKAMYEEEQGITFAGIICPVCKEVLLEDAIMMLNEGDIYFCSECNILLWIENEK